MIKKPVMILLLIFLFLLPGVFGYCNETQVYTYSNISLDNSTQIVNVTTIQSCTTEVNNTGFLSTGIILSVFTLMLLGGIFYMKKSVWKLLLFIPLNLMILILITFVIEVMEATNPEMTALLGVLNQIYYVAAIIIYPVIVIVFFILARGLVQAIFDKRKKKDDEWGDL